MSSSTPKVPANREAEEHLLGAVLLTPAALDRVGLAVTPGDFYWRSHGVIYATALEMRRRELPIDTVTLAGELEKQGHLDDVGGPGKLIELATLTPAATSAPHYARLIRDASRNRQIVEAATELQRAATNGGIDEHPAVLELVQQALAVPADTDELIPLDLDELLSGDPPETPWVWNGWIAEGDLALVVADPGVGKSLTMLALLEALRHGRPFLGEPTVKLDHVGMVDLENPTSEVASRLYGLGIRPGNTDGLHYLHAPPLDISSPAGIAAIEAFIVRHKLRFLVLDSFRRLAPGADENDSAAVSSVFTPLRVITSRTGCTIAVIHHGRKRMQGSDGHDPEPRGSGDFRASVDVMLYLKRKQADEPTFVLSHEKNRHGHPHRSIQVAILSDDESNRIVLESEGPVVYADSVRDTLKERVLELLRERGTPLSAGQIAVGVNRKPNDGSLGRALRELYDADRIGRTKQGRQTLYAAIPEGLE